jgi:hypothetical protein
MVKNIAGQVWAPLKYTPRGMSCSSSLTNTSWKVRVRLTVPRMPSTSQSPLTATPGASAGTAM